MNRKQRINEIANHILKLNLTHPTRVGVSGITASGKQHLQTNSRKKYTIKVYV